MTLQAITSGGLTVFMDERVHDLTLRRLELENMTEYDPTIYPALWDALADDYDEVYPGGINAQKCRQKAEHYRGAL